MIAGFGPSSNVKAMVDLSPVYRIVGPNSWEDGAAAAQENIPPAAQMPPVTTSGPMKGILVEFSHLSAKYAKAQPHLRDVFSFSKSCQRLIFPELSFEHAAAVTDRRQCQPGLPYLQRILS